MTDSVEAPEVNENLERLVQEYEQGVAERESSEAAAWLNARTEIEAQWEDLTDSQADRVEDADETLVQNAGQVASRLAATGGGSLSAQRAATPRPPEQWWWYLDVMSHVSDYYQPAGAAKPPASVWSKLLTAIEVIVLVVAIFLLGQNILPRIIPTPSPSPFPSLTPAPTETLNAAAFDMSGATAYKSQFNVIEMQVPKGWDIGQETAPGEYQVSYGQGGANSASIQIAMGEPATLYEQILGVTASVATPKEALDSFKQTTGTQSSFKFGETQAAKLGNLEGFLLPISIPAGPQRPDTEIELRIAPQQNGKIVFVIVQATKSFWTMGQPVIQKMLDSLVINAQNIPTPTPTLTPHPLRLTQTAVQQQIEALTPTVTPTPGPATAPATAVF